MGWLSRWRGKAKAKQADEWDGDDAGSRSSAASETMDWEPETVMQSPLSVDAESVDEAGSAGAVGHGRAGDEAVLCLSENLDGEDFVVGDIHGEFSRLRESLDALGFEPETDRLFSVGDLVDRGPESDYALDWLEQPWFYAVLGNHEEMALNAWEDEEALQWWTDSNGGDWWLGLTAKEQERFIQAFRRLPLAIDIETQRGRVGIVHADVPSVLDWTHFLDDLRQGDERLRQHVLWARSRAMGRRKNAREAIDGVERVFCGHTPLRRPTRLGNVYLLDTGACYPGGSLTVTGLWS